MADIKMIAEKEKTCKGCFWWKHDEGKKICQRSGPTYSCKDWSDKKKPKMCANCTYFNNFEECDSTKPDSVCMWHTTLSESLPIVPDRAEVKRMLKDGMSALEISEHMGLEMIPYGGELPTPDTNQITLLKHHLNTVLSLIPIAEMNAKVYPSMNNIYAVTALLGASREIMDDVNNRMDPGEQYTRLVKEILEPLTTSFLEVLTQGIYEMRGKCRDITQEGKVGVLEQIISMSLKGTASEMQTVLVNHLQKLQLMLGVASAEKPVGPNPPN
jgi:hypothetical protein